MRDGKRWLKRGFTAFALALVLCLIMAGLSIRKVVSELPDMYGVWGVGELMVEYLERNDTMPISWESLEPLWREGHGLHARSGSVNTFDELKEMIEIDFSRLHELELVARNGGNHSPVIVPASGATGRWNGADADEMIVNYLREQLAEGNHAALTH